jgi:hypothetical protein
MTYPKRATRFLDATGTSCTLELGFNFPFSRTQFLILDMPNIGGWKASSESAAAA